MAAKSLIAIAFLALGGFLTVGRITYMPTMELFTDPTGEKWRMPFETFWNDLATTIMEFIPSGNYKLEDVYQLFDLENDSFTESIYLNLLFAFGFAGFFSLIVGLVFFLRWKCQWFGGTRISRHGYSELEINAGRGSIMVASFIVVGLLLYQLFENIDLHRATGALLDSFNDTGAELISKIDKIAKALPDNADFLEFDAYDRDIFAGDLNFTMRYAKQQTAMMLSTVKKYEGMRYALVFIGFIVGVLSCCIGITGGNMMMPTLLLIEIIASTVTMCFVFLGFALHFGVDKAVRGYCKLTYDYGKSPLTPPMKVQYFQPCGSSPLYDFIYDHYSVQALLLEKEFNDKVALLPPSQQFPSQLWSAMASKEVAEKVKAVADVALTAIWTDAVHQAEQFALIEDLKTCSWAKRQWEEDRLLMCRYVPDNMDMLWITELLSVLFTLILIFSSIGMINKFTWAENANIRGFLNAQMAKMSQRTPKPKRFVL